MLSLLPKVEEV